MIEFCSITMISFFLYCILFEEKQKEREMYIDDTLLKDKIRSKNGRQQSRA